MLTKLAKSCRLIRQNQSCVDVLILHLDQGTHKNGDEVAVKRLYYDLEDEHVTVMINPEWNLG
jgi:hypothetical protein